MKRKISKIRRRYIGFRIKLRILRLHFMYLREPEDAMSPEEMLAEIKRRSRLT